MSITPITLKRISGDIKNFHKNKPLNIKIYPDANNILEIYFILDGLPETNFQDGQYICKLVHHPTYPLKAPDYYVYTPNGRFEIGRKICLTNSGFHQSKWAPGAWNLVTLLNGFSSIWHSNSREDKIGIGHIRQSKVENENFEIKKLAQISKKFNDNNYKEIINMF